MYKTKTFDIPELKGISQKTISEHLSLYSGYVKHVNHIHSELDNVTDLYAKSEMQRRLGFEFGGMRNHEYYFTQFEGGSKIIPKGNLLTLIEKQFTSVDNFIKHIRNIAMTRGVGWVMAYIDRQTNQIVCTWVDEQQLGHLADLDIILALDMWEHSYMLDYPPSKKILYIDAFFINLNWEVVSSRV